MAIWGKGGEGMGRTVRPERSGKKSPYWLEKHRYYELEHFCLQYPTWKKAYAALDGLSRRPIELAAHFRTNALSDPTARCAEAMLFYSERMDMLVRVAKATDLGLWDYILAGVTEGLSYDQLKARLEIPCGRAEYYDFYRRFFWLLDKERQ